MIIYIFLITILSKTFWWQWMNILHWNQFSKEWIFILFSFIQKYWCFVVRNSIWNENQHWKKNIHCMKIWSSLWYICIYHYYWVSFFQWLLTVFQHTVLGQPGMRKSKNCVLLSFICFDHNSSILVLAAIHW